MADIPNHLKAMYDRVESAPITPEPSPWRRFDFAVGGLTDIGFAEDTDFLIVLSGQGRAVFDCTTGERVERDYDPEFPQDYWNLTTQGFGVLEGQVIHTAGLAGGGLSRGTSDGWMIHRFTFHWPEEVLLLTPPGHWIYGNVHSMGSDFYRLGAELEVRAFGFSPTGRSLVIATGSDLAILTKKS
jgi:hypothetical protein